MQFNLILLNKKFKDTQLSCREKDKSFNLKGMHQVHYVENTLNFRKKDQSKHARKEKYIRITWKSKKQNKDIRGISKG